MSSCLPERGRFQRAAVEWLRKLGYWGDEKSIRARMDEVRRSFDATDYSYHLEEDFDQSLIYFLSAVEHLKAQGRESESLAETVGRYVVGMSSSFESAGLLELVRHELREVIDALTSDYSASSSRLSQLEGAPGPEPVLDLFLESLLSRRAVHEIFAPVFDAWTASLASVDACAHYVDLMTRTRVAPTSLGLFTNSLILRHAFDRERVADKWKVASAKMKSVCSDAHIEAIEELFDSDTEAD